MNISIPFGYKPTARKHSRVKNFFHAYESWLCKNTDVRITLSNVDFFWANVESKYASTLTHSQWNCLRCSFAYASGQHVESSCIFKQKWNYVTAYKKNKLCRENALQTMQVITHIHSICDSICKAFLFGKLHTNQDCLISSDMVCIVYGWTTKLSTLSMCLKMTDKA